MKFDNLLSSKKIGNLQLKNRFIVPSMGTGYGDTEGYLTKQSFDYYVERAKGGFGLVITEAAGVNYHGVTNLNSAGMWSDDFIDQWKELTDEMHKYGAKVAVQLNDVGRQANSALTRGAEVVSSSAVACPVFDVVPKELTVEEIYEAIGRFGDGARRAKEAGFDAVELHGGHGFLIAQFLSPLVNKRYDEFGGDLEGRAKFATEIIKDIRKKCGDDLAIIVKMSGDEKLPGGMNISDAKVLAKYLEEAGADAIHVTICAFPSINWMSAPADVEPGFNAYAAREIKESLNIPVIAVNRINTPEIAEDILVTGKADFVSLGRASLADPEFPNKVAAGKINEISPCIACLQSCLGYMLANPPRPSSCLVNPRTGYEAEYKFLPTEKAKKIAIVGSGPAGLQASWILAKRGHDVTLYEKSNHLGGQFRIGGIPPTKQLINRAIKYYITMAKKYGVDIKTGVEVTPDLIESTKPDALILATGGQPLVPKIKGIDNPNVVNAVDVIDGKALVGRNVLIVGGGIVGVETADFLREHNRMSTIIDLLPDIAMELVLGTREHLLKRLNDYGVKAIVEAEVKEFLDDGVIYVKDGKEEVIQGFDSIVNAMGVKSYNPLEDKIKDLVDEVYVIGDANETGQANDATEAATELANRL